MHPKFTHASAHTPGHPSSAEQDLAVAVVLWIMLAGICVVMANAWAAGLFTDVTEAEIPVATADLA